MENATLTNLPGVLAKAPDLTLTINRSDLARTMIGTKTLKAQLADGTAKAEGNLKVLEQLASTMVDCLVLPTKP
jgi:alkyl sulfatase BDS1-like metallo-beta-lactamase superfamily hydrolase